MKKRQSDKKMLRRRKNNMQRMSIADWGEQTLESKIKEVKISQG